MASFDPAQTGGQGTEERQQFPYRRVELSINKFIKILEIDLDRLHHHKLNLNRFHAIQDWKSCDKEQINSSRTVQQIKATVRQLEQTRKQVIPEDLPKFDNRMNAIQEKALSAVAEFLNKQQPELPGEVKDLHPFEEFSSLPPNVGQNGSTSRAEWKGTRGLSESYIEPIAQLQQLQESQQQLLLDPESIPDANAEQSWMELRDSLEELNGLMKDFGQLVHAQQETVDRIEDNVETAEANVEEGVNFLAVAAKLKAGVFPIAGALIGGALGGPVGLVAGFKLAGLAAVGGSVIGFTGGSLLKKHADQTVDTEMQNLNKDGSRSMPDLKEEKS